ncbi:alpha/beta hydrolase [Actinocorallia sp. B10E7]|uniref:alpha/beta hydrolase family protein n=1 Tax=Actinocorallia sp. B10E7 TaxID=3153558 RepID=UPI00325CC207
MSERLVDESRYETIGYGLGEDRFGHLWQADGTGPRPVAVLLHGGYWRAPYRLDLMNPLAASLAAGGVSVWNLEYRRIGTPGGGWPGLFDDVEAGFGILDLLAAEHGLDLSRVAVVGHSAGGHLALWLATRTNAVRPALTVALAPVSDLVGAHRMGLSNDAAAELMRGTYARVPERYRAHSPRALLPLGARLIVVHGRRDETVPCGMSAEFCAAASTAGDDCEFLLFDAADHFALIDPGTEAGAQVSSRIIAELSG